MRDSSSILAELAASGMTPEQLSLVMQLSVALVAEARPVGDVAAERRRKSDRERKACLRNSAESADGAETLPLPSKERVSPTPPSETQPTNPIQLPPIVPQNSGRKARLKGDFAKFWAEYPLKVGKLKAERSYVAALGKCETDNPEAEILEGLRRCKPLWAPEFIPHATTWLNRGGWLDQLVPDIPDATGPVRLDLAKFDEERARMAAKYEQENAA